MNIATCQWCEEKVPLRDELIEIHNHDGKECKGSGLSSLEQLEAEGALPKIVKKAPDFTAGKPCKVCKNPTEDWPIKPLDKPHKMALEVAPDYRAFSKEVWSEDKGKTLIQIICAKCLRKPGVYDKVMALRAKQPDSQ